MKLDPRSTQVWRLCVRLGWFLTSLFLVLNPGHLTSADGTMMWRVTRSIVDRGAVDVEPLESWPKFGGAWTTDTRTGEPKFYAKFAPGQSVVAVPAYVLGKVLVPLVGTAESEAFSWDNPLRITWYPREDIETAFLAWAASWTNAWLAGLAGVLLFLIVLELGYGQRIGMAIALSGAIATPVLHYATTFFAEILAAVGVLGFLWAMLRSKRPDAGAGWWALGGFSLGVCLTAKVAFATLALPGGIYLLFVLHGQSGRVLRGTALVAGYAVPVLAILAYNQVRFGTPWETGYGGEVGQWTTPIATGLGGLLVSPGRGLLFYVPLVVPSLMVFPRFFRRHPSEGLFVALSLLTLVLTFFRWHAWAGGFCWGPRFLLPVVPLVVLPLLALADATDRDGLLLRRMALLGLAAGLVVSLNGQFVDHLDYYFWLLERWQLEPSLFTGRGYSDLQHVMGWDWSHSPLVRYWSFPVRDALFLPHALSQPGLVRTLNLVFVASLVASGVSMVRWAKTASASD